MVCVKKKKHIVFACRLGGSIHTVKKNAETLVAATKETGLQVNAHKTKCMTVSREQNAGRIHSKKMHNSPIEMADEFKYLEEI